MNSRRGGTSSPISIELLLECTDLSVFARTVQEAVSVPVYDINSLIAYAAFCVRRNQWV